jgi:hypothetical protein
MQFFRSQKVRITIVACAALAVGCIALNASPALAKAKASKKADQPQVVLGTVKSVDSNSITVDTKKGGSKQFQLTGDTTYKQAAGKKGGTDSTAARTDVKEGARVAVTVKGDKADSVLIEGTQKKGKKKNA